MIFLTKDFRRVLNYSVCFRLEEKIADLETEDQILRQQTLLKPPSRKMSGQMSGRITIAPNQVSVLKDFSIVRSLRYLLILFLSCICSLRKMATM